MSSYYTSRTHDSQCVSPWLPKGFEFLSGLPTEERKRRTLVLVQVYADESGGKGQTRHFLMAALMSTAEKWACFSDEWRACLAQHPRVGQFKMKDAASCTGQFFGFSEPQRDDKLRALARIINRYANAITYSCIDLDAHDETWARALEKPWSEPYFWPYQNTIMASCFELWGAGLRERFEMIFDANVIFGPRARHWYPLIQDVVRHREPEAATILPVDPMFRDDAEFRPLQAADLFAWCIRDATDIQGAGQFEWLLDELRSVSLSDYSQYYDRERMVWILEQRNEMARAGPLPIHIRDKYQELITLKRKH